MYDHPAARRPAPPLRIVVWGEHLHEGWDPRVAAIYPEGMHHAIADGLRDCLGPAAVVGTATLEDDWHGLQSARLAQTDVLFWWGHAAHERVGDDVAENVARRVDAGMGLVVLHSAHLAKPFRLLMGTSCALRWREGDDRELVWTVDPGHPIARGVPHPLVIPRHEMYGEYFDIPQPNEQVFISSFSGGEVFRSGCCYRRGRGRVFYFSPGHETYPVFHMPEIRLILANAARWAGEGAGAPAHAAGDGACSLESPAGWFGR